MLTSRSTQMRSLALAAMLASLTIVADQRPVAHADAIDPGHIVCTMCPPLPQPPSLAALTLTDKGDALAVQGSGFTSWGGIDLYLWRLPNTSANPTFAGTIHTAAHGSALTLQIPVIATKPGQYCSHPEDIFAVAIDDSTHLSSGLRHFAAFPQLGCYALKLSPITARPSLNDRLNASAGTIHVWGHRYTPHTSIIIYLLQNNNPVSASLPTTLVANGSRFAANLSTGHLGCSDTLSWTMFALDQSANAASPLPSTNDPCSAPPK